MNSMILQQSIMSAIRHLSQPTNVVTITPYTLQSSDAGKIVQMNLSEPSMVYVDASQFSSGQTITLQNTGGGVTSLSGNMIPVEGDFVFCAVSQQGNTSPTADGSPSISFFNSAASNAALWLGATYYQWQSSDNQRTYYGWNMHGSGAAVAQVLTGVNATNPINASSITPDNTSAASGNRACTAASITTTVPNCLLIYFCALQCDGNIDNSSGVQFTPPTGFTNPIICEFMGGAGGPNMGMAFKEMPTAGTTGSVSGSINTGLTSSASISGLVAIAGSSSVPTLRNWRTEADNSNTFTEVPFPFGTKVTGDFAPAGVQGSETVEITITDDHTVNVSHSSTAPSAHLLLPWMDGLIDESNGTWTDPIDTNETGSTFIAMYCSKFGISGSIEDNKGNNFTVGTIPKTGGFGCSYGYCINGTGGTNHRSVIYSGDDNTGVMLEARGINSFVGEIDSGVFATNGVGSLSTGSITMQAGDLGIAMFYADTTNGSLDTMGLAFPTNFQQVLLDSPLYSGVRCISAFTAPADGSYNEVFTFPTTMDIASEGAIAILLVFRP